MLQKALGDTGVMMNTIAYFQQQYAQQGQQTSQEPQGPQEPQGAPDESDKESETSEDNEDSDEKHVQFEDKIDDIEEMTSKKSWVDWIINRIKEPIILTIIFVILFQPSVQKYIIGLIPRLQDAPILQMGTFAVIFFTLTFVIQFALHYS